MHTLLNPFHPGELAVQEKLGVRERVQQYAPQMIRSHLPDQHRELLEKLPFILVGSIDAKQQPTASMLFGYPGFIETLSETNVRFTNQLLTEDPLSQNLKEGGPLGFLAIELETRRRNRMNGKTVNVSENGFEMHLDQSFGNCPQYIQTRSFTYDGFDPKAQIQTQTRRSPSRQELKQHVEQADTFFIASSYFNDVQDETQGVDVSHRGGKPGFVKLDKDVITFPDFSGNNIFNTIGNIALNPKVGLLFPDFEKGNLLFIHGEADIIWDGPEVGAIEGAQRLVTVKITQSFLIENAIPSGWHLHDYSPSLNGTGTFAPSKDTSDWSRLRIDRIERESDTINSFYLTPIDGKPVPMYLAGQHLPIRLPAKPKAPRTYTLSRSASGGQYRLSVKREANGEVSKFLHDKARVGDIIEAKKPAGAFVLNEKSSRPVLFVSAGVGITPMIAMLETLTRDEDNRRSVTFIHATRNGREHAFKEHPALQDTASVETLFAYSKPETTDIVEKSFHVHGRLTKETLNDILAQSDIDVYLCGPASFMQKMRQNLIELGVPDNQILQEAFGTIEAGQSELPDIDVPVSLKSSGMKVKWNPSTGSLLDHIEKAGVEPPYSCRSGSCGTCLTKIMKGKVTHPESTAFATQEDEALICCALPNGEDPEQELILDL